MATNRLSITLDLDRIFCHDEGDGWGNAEPYLWTVFFKVDGSSIAVNESLTLSGNATIHTTPGSHGNLNTTDVDAGDNVSIPSSIGHFETILEPIPLSPPWDALAGPIGGLVGVVVVLMEEDNVTDDGAEAGHAALNNAVRDAINQIVATRSLTNQDVTEEEMSGFTNSIESAVSSAIQNQQNFFENLWSWLNADDSIGMRVFLFRHSDLDSGGTINFSERWHSEGDWELFGHITSTVICPADALDDLFSSLYSSRNMLSASAFSPRMVIDTNRLEELREDTRTADDLRKAFSARGKGSFIELASLHKFRDGTYQQYPGLKYWWALARINVTAVVDAVLRHPELRSPLITIIRFTEEFARDSDHAINEESIEAAKELFLGLKRVTGNRRLSIDCSRALAVLPMLRGKPGGEVLNVLSNIRPARHPSLTAASGATSLRIRLEKIIGIWPR